MVVAFLASSREIRELPGFLNYPTIGEDQAHSCCLHRLLHLGPSAVAETERDDRALDILARPGHLAREAFDFFHRQVELDLADDPDRQIGARWVINLPEKIDLLFCTIPLLPTAGQWLHRPALLAGQHVMHHDIGHILQVATQAVAETADLPAQLLQLSLIHI